jgi:hypothetical protein
MQVPSQKPPISSVYLNMLQSRQASPVAARSIGATAPAATPPRLLDPGSAPRGSAAAPRGSIIDIKV